MRSSDTAVDARARTAILTASDTPYDDVADWKIEERLETVLPAIRAAIAAGPTYR